MTHYGSMGRSVWYIYLHEKATQKQPKMDVHYYTIPFECLGGIIYMWLHLLMLFKKQSISDVSHALFNIQERISSCLFGTPLLPSLWYHGTYPWKRGQNPEMWTWIDIEGTVHAWIQQQQLEKKSFKTWRCLLQCSYLNMSCISIYILFTIYIYIYIYMCLLPPQKQKPRDRHINIKTPLDGVKTPCSPRKTEAKRECHVIFISKARSSLGCLWIPGLIQLWIHGHGRYGLFFTTKFQVVFFSGVFHVRQISHTLSIWEIDFERLICW